MIHCEETIRLGLVASLMKDATLVEILRSKRKGFYVGKAFVNVGGEQATQFLRDNANAILKTESGVLLAKHAPHAFAAKLTPRASVPSTTPHGVRAFQEKHDFSETEVFLDSKNVSIILTDDIKNLTWNKFLNHLLFNIGLSFEGVWNSEIRILYGGRWHSKAEVCGIPGDLMIAREATVVVST